MDDERASREATDGASGYPFVLEAGTVLARKYELVRPAGFGGMAQLWVAKNKATGADVCIKVLVPEADDEESVERFRREAYAAARLSHRAIIRIFDLVELGESGEVTDGKAVALAIVMELLHGETLGDLLMKRGKLPVAEAIDIAIPLASALAHAHRAGVVHRDLKPDNIFLSTDPDGHVTPKVLDFGVSKLQSSDAKALTVDGVMIGTPSYMSPEQAKGGRNVDARSDVFSAGILIYMMIAGENPFASDSFHSVLSAILHHDPPRLASVPEPIWSVIEKALAKEASARFADATELSIALRRASGRSTTTDPGLHPAVAPPSSVRKLVPALGGDSHVSVPPVSGGSSDARDSMGEPLPRATVPASRRRAVRIVIAVVGASLALTVAALFRSPTGSGATSATSAPSVARATSAPSVARATSAPSVARATSAPSAPTEVPAPSAPLAPSAPPAASTAAVSATEAAPRAAAEAGAPPSNASTSTTAAARNVAVAPPAPKPMAPPDIPSATAPATPFREPSIVRDPGF